MRGRPPLPQHPDPKVQAKRDKNRAHMKHRYNTDDDFKRNQIARASEYQRRKSVDLPPSSE